MSDSSEGIRVLAFSEPVLTRRAVERLELTLRDGADVRPTVLDCSAATAVTPRGLAALLELGRSAEGRFELSLCGLRRELMVSAVQAGLAERFSVYSDLAAFRAERGRS